MLKVIRYSVSPTLRVTMTSRCRASISISSPGKTSFFVRRSAKPSRARTTTTSKAACSPTAPSTFRPRGHRHLRVTPDLCRFSRSTLISRLSGTTRMAATSRLATSKRMSTTSSVPDESQAPRLRFPTLLAAPSGSALLQIVV